MEYETTSDIGETKRAEEICVDGNSTGWTEADVRRSVNRKFFFKSQSTFGGLNSLLTGLLNWDVVSDALTEFKPTLAWRA